MADIVLTGDTSGAITVAAPAVAGTNTLTLPANTGTLMTSTYTSGDVDIDSGTLHVDATNNRVGIGTSSPAHNVEIVATASGSVNDTLQIRNNATATGTGSRIRFINSTDENSDANGASIASIRTGGDNDLAFETENVERMRIKSNGDVLIGTTTDLAAGSEGVEIRGDLGVIYTARNTTANAGHILFYNPNGIVGSIQTTGTTTSYVTSSDYRLKEKVSPMSGSIDRLKQLKPSTWSWKIDGSHGEGFLAHEAQTVVPESATGTKDAMRTEEYEVTPEVLDDDGNVVTEAVMGTREVPDYQGIDQSKLVPLLTAALQEAVTKIEDLETRIQALENA
ncbi:tail structural protein [Methylophilales phage MEP401]|nr:tail structural protein [Methylophilales phage MEP401]